MRTIRVKLKNRSYDIVVGNNILPSVGKFLTQLNLGTDAYVITNDYLKNKYGRYLTRGLKKYNLGIEYKTIADTEKSKSLQTFSAVINDLAKYDFNKKPFIIAFGGGVVGDLAGFIASVYKRGTAYVQIPTTLLAQVDSSIGGKTAIDLPVGKNLVGAFYQPRLVVSDIGLLASLDKKQIVSGFAEVIKYALIRDAGLFSFLEKNAHLITQLNPKGLEHIIGRCCRIKSEIVWRDEREERGVRTILNFGHTIGHALESAGKYRYYNHGEAIALGMLVASDISRTMGLLENSLHQRIEKLVEMVGLPTQIEKIQPSEIIDAHYRDKKFIGATNRFVLLCGIGKTRIVENIPLTIIEFCIRARLAR